VADGGFQTGVGPDIMVALDADAETFRTEFRNSQYELNKY
jgi:hypothetical protein